MSRVLFWTLLAFVITACQGHNGQDTEATAGTSKDQTKSETEPMGLGVDLTGFDQTKSPGDDFYYHVNGQWLARTQIPADKSNYGSFIVLADDAEANIRTIIEQAADSSDRVGLNEQRIGDMYSSFMDVDSIQSLGLSPLQGDLKRIDEIESVKDIVAYIGYSQTQQLGSPIAFFVNQDAKQPTEYIAYMHHGGLSLPDRDYYLESNERFDNIRAKFFSHVEEIFTLAGVADAGGKAKQVVALETRLAEKHWSRVRNRDRDATYNKFSVAQANTLTPGLDWDAFLEAAKIGGAEQIVLRQPDYYTALGEMLKDIPPQQWRNYFKWRLLSGASPFLSQAFVDSNFEFFRKTLTGVEEQRPRWKRGVQLVNATMGELVGQLYVQRHFDETSKKRMDDLVENLREAFRQAIDELEWMSDETKVQAQGKLEKFTTKIGYPDQWKDYSDLDVQSDDLIGNLRRSNRVEYARQVNKLGRSVDRGEWFMTPQTVNAYYNPSMNEIVFPAAILQPPFFNVKADDAVNYGAIGAVIGHEFSHGFDDQGRKSDGDGKLTDWWTAEDATEFKARAGGLVTQYNKYSPIEDKHVNGELTLGENIGDLAGLTMAYRAYQLSLQGKQAPVIEGYTGDQRFFLGWAQVWRRKYRDDELVRRLTTDPHSPSRYRVIGILSNMPEFYSAFDIKKDDEMYVSPEDRVKIW